MTAELNKAQKFITLNKETTCSYGYYFSFDSMEDWREYATSLNPFGKAPTFDFSFRFGNLKWKGSAEDLMAALGNSQAVVGALELPPLPSSADKVAIHVRICDDIPKYTKEGSAEAWQDYYAADQMREYARAAIAADRAQQANLSAGSLTPLCGAAGAESAQQAGAAAPSDEQIDELASEHCLDNSMTKNPRYVHCRAFARDLLRRYAATPQDQGAGMQVATDARCPHCDDTGDVHRPDGEWMGECNCEAGIRMAFDRLKIAATKTEIENADLRAQLASQGQGEAVAYLIRDKHEQARYLKGGLDWKPCSIEDYELRKEQTDIFEFKPLGVIESPAQASAAQATEQINRVADELEDEAQSYEGDFADVVRGCVETLRSLIAAPEQARAAVPDGWQIVPARPTRQMVSAGARAQLNADKGAQANSLTMAVVSYAAMLAAAPSPAAPQQPVDVNELAFNATRLRNVARLVGLERAIPQDDATLDGARGSVLGLIAGAIRNAHAARAVEQPADDARDAGRLAEEHQTMIKGSAYPEYADFNAVNAKVLKCGAPENFTHFWLTSPSLQGLIDWVNEQANGSKNVRHLSLTIGNETRSINYRQLWEIMGNDAIDAAMQPTRGATDGAVGGA